MKNSIVIAVLLGLILFNCCGCIVLVAGGAGAAGAYAASRDTIEGDTDKSYNGLWRSAVSVAEDFGSIRRQDQQRGFIELRADNGGNVTIRIIRLTRRASRLRVSARNTYHLPDLGEAQRIYTRIIEGA